MSRTGQQIVSDVYALLRDGPTVRAITGGLYRGGLRPRDSRREDLVVHFTASDAGPDVQEGTVTLNLFVPFLEAPSGGVPTEDSARCEALETILSAELESWGAVVSDYRWRLRSAVHTQRDDQLHESFIVARLGFTIFIKQQNK